MLNSLRVEALPLIKDCELTESQRNENCRKLARYALTSSIPISIAALLVTERRPVAGKRENSAPVARARIVSAPAAPPFSRSAELVLR